MVKGEIQNLEIEIENWNPNDIISNLWNSDRLGLMSYYVERRILDWDIFVHKSQLEERDAIAFFCKRIT